MIIQKRVMYCPCCQSRRIKREHRSFLQKQLLKTKAMYKCGICEKSFSKEMALYSEDLARKKKEKESA